MDTSTRTPIVWDQMNKWAWRRNMQRETTRHRAAMTAQWPTDMRIGYMPNSGVAHMVPADQKFGGWDGTIPLCGGIYHGLVEMDTVQAKPCAICTDRYNEGATTGVKPDPFPVGARVEFDTMLGDSPSVTEGVIVPSRYKGYRKVEIKNGMQCDVRVENLRLVP